MDSRIRHHSHGKDERSQQEQRPLDLRLGLSVITGHEDQPLAAPSLLGAMLELGADRVMFSADYPFERMSDAAEWFDWLPISEADRLKIGRTNAKTPVQLGDPAVRAA